MENQNMLDNIIAWAQKEETVRALILAGSRARNEPIDFLADYDISVFVTDIKKYTIDSSWLTALGNTWVVVADKQCFNNTEYPTRLVIFDGGIKVDFAFYSVDLLKDLDEHNKLYQRFARGHKVLLDKDNLAINLHVAPLQKATPQAPTQQEFDVVVQEFFFEVYHVAKYLYRNDLWHAKFRDWAAKEFLLRMIEWHEHTRHGWEYNTWYLGVHSHVWMGKDTWADLQKVFGSFDAQDSWQALVATIELFRKLATQTAEKLGYQYPINVDKNITGFAQQLRFESEK